MREHSHVDINLRSRSNSYAHPGGQNSNHSTLNLSGQNKLRTGTRGGPGRSPTATPQFGPSLHAQLQMPNGSLGPTMRDSVNHQANSESDHNRDRSDFSIISTKVDDEDEKRNLAVLEKCPAIYLDGPYGAPAQKWDKFEYLVLIGGGIGITPFASIITDLLIRYYDRRLPKVRRVYLYWVSRNEEAFEWFANILRELQKQDDDNLLRSQTYLTGAHETDDIRSWLLWEALNLVYKKTKTDLVTGLPSRTHWGRPDFRKIFTKLAKQFPGKDIGVFFCGPDTLSKSLSELSKELSMTETRTFFHFHKESFGH